MAEATPSTAATPSMARKYLLMISAFSGEKP
jgi:hypothetical protein